METCEKFEEWWTGVEDDTNLEYKDLAWAAWEHGIASLTELMKEVALELKKEPISTRRFTKLLTEIPDAQRKEIIEFLSGEYDANGCKK